MPARSSKTKSPPSSLKPNARQRIKARRVLEAAGITTDAQAVPYLGGNWRRLKPPPVTEFIESCLIVEKEGETDSGLIPFKLWDAQHEALACLIAEPFVAALKARQIGITWLVLALMLYEGRFGGNRTFPIARQSEDYAKDAIRRLLTLAGYDADSDLPDLRVLPESPMPAEWRPRIVAKSLTELRADNGSTWTAHTATQSLARGLIGYRGLADEFAFWPWPSKQRAAMESGCAHLDIVSTGNGEGDDFHNLWDLAVAGKGKYRPLFIPATADPRRDDEWFRLNVTEDADPDLARREYAMVPEDAFRCPEGVFFKRWTRERNVADIEPVDNWPTYRCVDFGYRHPACLWLQLSPAGQPVVVAELAPENVTTDELVAMVQDIDAGMALVTPATVTYCDPAGKAANVQTAESEFEVFRAAGLHPVGRPSGRRDGCVRIMDAIADPHLPLVVSTRCPGLIRALSQVKPHKTSPEVYDFDHVTFSHPLDALRYWFVNHRGGVGFEAPPVGRSRTAGDRSRVF